MLGKFPWIIKLRCLYLLYLCPQRYEGAHLQKKDHEQEADEEEDVEQELEEKEKEEEYCEVETEELNSETWQREEHGGADYSEQTSLSFGDSYGEKSLNLPESPRPLSRETRNLTASELLINKSVELMKNKIEAFLWAYTGPTKGPISRKQYSSLRIFHMLYLW